MKYFNNYDECPIGYRAIIQRKKERKKRGTEGKDYELKYTNTNIGRQASAV